MAQKEKQTPMMAQYHRLKKECPDGALLLFRLGDFYELFFDDAKEGAAILKVALTKRGSTPMCGIPYHAASSYIGRILKAGRNVAICEQTEEPKPGKLVERAITQILSPGSHFDDRLLNEEKNNYLVTLSRHRKAFGLASIDLTTGAFSCSSVADPAALYSELERLQPSEIIIPESDTALANEARRFTAPVNEYEDWVFEPENARYALLSHFNVASLDGFGIKDEPAATGAAGAALSYVSQSLRRDVTHLVALRFYQNTSFVTLDAVTLRNLEILEPLDERSSEARSLSAAMNQTKTPMGARKLREWLSLPLRDIEEIHRRQRIVGALLEDADQLEALTETLGQVRDIERASSRLHSGHGGPRDASALRESLERLPEIQAALQELRRHLHETPSPHEMPGLESEDDGSTKTQEAIQAIISRIPNLGDLLASLRQTLVEEPPAALKDGGVIRDGRSPGLDELRAASRDGKNWIAKLQSDEIEATGIPSLKVRFNNVFGYFIEITRTHLDKVPSHYVRKQTIANGERFITEDLKNVEGKILGADERALKLEQEIFQDLRDEISQCLPGLQQAASALGELDALAAFAENARLFGYCRPHVADQGMLNILDGRHPILDQATQSEPFVPNDTVLDLETTQIALITGPNMAGKSTYIRQTALITLLALTGSYVPAREARVDVVDRIFTRIGASDDLARGQSTFMVEMTEAANILNHATRDSLIVLDEIGRGTSTFDGISLAWSIVEHLHHQIGAKTLFATHYHELTELERRLSRLKNFNVAVREYNDQIVFLRKIIEGAADKSYGIHVARLAGAPTTVVERAKEILRNLEESELTPEGRGRRGRKRNSAERQALADLPEAPQMDLFIDYAGSENSTSDASD